MDQTLERAIGRVVEGTRHWSPARWSQDGNAEAMLGLIQALADVCAEAEGEARREVPRLSGDQHLPDQLQVIGLDLFDVADRLTSSQTDAVEAAIQKARNTLF